MSAKKDVPTVRLFKNKLENVQGPVKRWGVCKFVFADLYECMSGSVFYMRYIALWWFLNTPKPAGLGGKDGVLTVSPAVGGLERLPARQH